MCFIQDSNSNYARYQMICTPILFLLCFLVFIRILNYLKLKYFVLLKNIVCPTTYKTRHFFNNSKTNEDIATKQTYTTDTFLFISRTTNVLVFISRCNIFIGFRIIKEIPGLLGVGTPCIFYVSFSLYDFWIT
jgi:hypothetical protein